MEILANSQRFVGADVESWNVILKNAVRDPRVLCSRLGLPTNLADEAAEAAGDFSLFCPEPLLRRIQLGNPNDPILLQLLPRKEEQQQNSAFVYDPLEETRFEKAPGLLQKYQGRALLVATGVCAVHCRYCFRRFYPYPDAPKSITEWRPAIDAIYQDRSIHEVILSGGDPLVLTDNVLAELANELDLISHVTRLRIHTRLPIMIPQRTTEALLDLIGSLRMAVVVVIHCNHANEIDNPVRQSLAFLRKAGATLLNQSVLLRNINDDVDVLIELSETLIESGVVPYYLHQLDPVQGAEHFEVDLNRGREIMIEMRNRSAGYMVPRFVVEQPGKASKTLLL
jgi:EF-P beta-lysylation protein EpmB